MSLKRLMCSGNWPLLGASRRGVRPDVPPVRQAIHILQQGQGSKGAKTKEGGGNSDGVLILMMLAQLVLVAMLGSSRNIKVGGFTKFVSREIATARSRHTSWRRWIPMPASPRHRARCNRHEARAGFVALISCCRQAQHRRFGFAMVPLQRAAWTRYLSVVMSETAAKQFFFRCAQRNSYLRSRTCQLFMRPREAGLTDKPPPSRPQRISSPLASVSLLVPQLCRCSIGSPHACSSFFALHSQNVTLQICLHIATLLSGSQICFRSVRRCEGRA